ncbi:Hypothetical predicted protein [Xyrichtys novacula]|uniref:Uncharacterized protein n=1 Tax=Xyrichtys novacula TaxID=13765 RepID=A0AAV1GVY7_XYRNO|nr:Hypothetical predicted protein [Xyrichtys novacula]
MAYILACKEKKKACAADCENFCSPISDLTPSPSPSSLYLRSEPWTRPPQPPHDSPTGALDQVS